MLKIEIDKPFDKPVATGGGLDNFNPGNGFGKAVINFCNFLAEILVSAPPETGWNLRSRTGGVKVRGSRELHRSRA